MSSFAMSYSLGKDSALAFFRMIDAGFNPVCLVTMFSRDVQRSWFHGANEKLLREASRCIGVRSLIMPCAGDDYAGAFEKGLAAAKEMGANFCAFGDIDLEPNRRWEEDRCANAGLSPVFPLWKEDRLNVVKDLLANGFNCLVKTINTENLPFDAHARRVFCEKYLGQPLSLEFVANLLDAGLDGCGENGEYHTLTCDGPIFKKPLSVRVGKILWLHNHATIEIDAA